MTSVSIPLISFYILGIAATIVATVSVFIFARRYGWEVPRWFLIGMIAVVPPLLFVQQLLKYASLHMYADFSHWLQLLQSIATIGLPHSTTVLYIVPGALNYLSVHFVPLVYLFALPFKIFPYPQTILVLNVLAMCSAAIPLYLLARHRTGDRRFALLCAALLLWYPTFQYTTLYEFEMLRFSIPAILWMLYAWERQRIGWYYVLIILAASVREEVGLTVGMFGAYLAFIERRWWHGLFTACTGFGAFVFILYIMMPALFRSDVSFSHIAAGSFAAGSFAHGGMTPGAVLASLVHAPGIMLASVMQPIKIANLAMLFFPLLGIPLLAPTALIPALASFGIALLSEGATHSSYMLYYVSPAVPFLFYTFIVAWPKVVAWVERRMRPRYGMDGDGRTVPALMIAALMGMLVVNVFFSPSPLALQFWSNRFHSAPFKTQSFSWLVYRVTDHHRAAKDIIARIPDDAIVSTQQFLMPRLAHVRGTMEYPQFMSRDGQYRAEYVLLDDTNNGLRAESPAAVSSEEFDLVRLHPTSWELVAQQDAYVLYRIRP